jgi:molybdopterin synthase sulfur carrier subunit
MTGVQVLYFASLRQAAGVETEAVQTQSLDLEGLYGELKQRHGFAWETQHLRVAVDGVFAHWDDAPSEGAQVAFIPPVSGG